MNITTSDDVGTGDDDV